MSLQENISTLTVPVNTHAGTFEDIDVDAFELSDEEFNAKYGTGNHGLGSSIQMIQKPQNNSVAKAAAQKRATKAAKMTSINDDDHVSTQYAEHVLENRSDLSAYRMDDETSIYRWDGRHYLPVSVGDGIADALKWLRCNVRKKATDATAKEAWTTLETTLRGERSFAEFDFGDEKIIPCADGYLHFDTLGNIVFKAPDRQYGFRHLIQVKCGLQPGDRLNPAPLRPDSRFARFLDHILPDKEVQAFVQEQCAMTFLPINYQMSAWWYGQAKTGKSTLKDLMALFHAKNNVVQMKLNEIDVPFNTQRLLGATLITTDEVKMKGNWHEETWKSIVSQSPMTIQRKHKTSVNNYEIKAKWIVCSNQSPKISDDSEGVWRRLSLVQFNNPIIDGATVANYHHVLFKEEGFEILQWILEGAQRLVKRGRFLGESEWPESCRRTKGEARTEANTVTHWCEEQNVNTCGKFTDKTVVYSRYLDFCNAIQIEAMAPNIFWRYVRARFVGYQEKKLKIKDAMGRYTQPYVANIMWCDDDDKDLEYLNETVDIPFGK